MATSAKVQHTPGPWETIQHGDFLDVIQEGRDGYGTICRIENSDCNPVSLRELAAVNARLIAAAPELLEALIMIHRVMIQCGMQEDKQEVADAAWLAIRKARAANNLFE